MAKRSKIWQVSDKEFIDIIKTSRLMKDALAAFGLENKGSNYKTLKDRISQLGLDISHFRRNAREKRKETLKQTRRVPLEEILVRGSSFSRHHLKKKLL